MSSGRSAAEQMQALGYSPADLTHVLMTHLDKDHAGGLLDFPGARVCASEAEIAAALRRPAWIDRQRYHPGHFSHSPKWVSPEEPLLEVDGLSAHRIPGLPETILAIPLPGHSRGHQGIALRTRQGWLLHCGDAVYHRAWLDGARPAAAMRLAERTLCANPQDLLESRRRLLRLRQDGRFTVFCSHDRRAFEDLGGIY
jgi:glyoxylase-like metal-dependent hydrolase (beta-lactamase superfamily II)